MPCYVLDTVLDAGVSRPGIFSAVMEFMLLERCPRGEEHAVDSMYRVFCTSEGLGEDLSEAIQL